MVPVQRFNAGPIGPALIEEDPSCCEKFYNLIKRVCSAVVNFFIAVVRCIFCCDCGADEELPAGPINRPPLNHPPVTPYTPPVVPNPYQYGALPQPVELPLSPRPRPPYDPFNNQPFNRPNPIPYPFPPIDPLNHPPIVAAPEKPKPSFPVDFPIPLVPLEHPKVDDGARIPPLPVGKIQNIGFYGQHQQPAFGGFGIYGQPPDPARVVLQTLTAGLLQPWEWALTYDPNTINKPKAQEYVDGLGLVDAEGAAPSGEIIHELGSKNELFYYYGPKSARLEQVVRDSCDLLTPQAFIEMLNSYRQPFYPGDQPIVANVGEKAPDDRFEVDIALDNNPEVAFKRKVARLALIWIAAKRDQFEATADLTYEFAPIYQDLAAFKDVLKKHDDPEDRQITLPHNYQYGMRNSWALDKGHDSSYVQARRTLIGVQELTRIMPLIQAFAAEKKKVTVQHLIPGNGWMNHGAKTFKAEVEVNYLRDVVLLMTQGMTRIKTYSSKSTGISLVETDAAGKTVERKERDLLTGKEVKKVEKKIFRMDEVNSDKVISYAEMIWKGYHIAKGNDDLEGYFKAISSKYCFDARMSEVTEYLQSKDFILEIDKLAKDEATKLAEYQRVFFNEQVAIFVQQTFHQDGFAEVRKQIIAEGLDPDQLKEFRANYATSDRFRAWLHKQNETQSNEKAKVKILEADDWQNVLDTLEMMCIGFEVND